LSAGISSKTIGSPDMRSTLKERVVIQAVRDGTLSIDAEGRVWRHFIIRNGRRYSIPVKRAEYGNTRFGVPTYLAVQVFVNGRRVTVLAHRLVWQFFHGDIPEDREINHRDGRKRNNRPSNLEITTTQGNSIHSYQELDRTRLPGELNPWSKLTEDQILFVRDSLSRHRYTGVQLAALVGCSAAHISRIKLRQTWRHL